ncbi:MAG: hypothetical protein M1587_05385, partial [Thaumarchaeota archaeon]|nr:hypothetical protein [Nitrososphaerota archaeon]
MRETLGAIATSNRSKTMTHGAKATVFLRLSLMPLFLVHVGNGFAQDIGCPQVLCYSRAKPYI